MRGFIGLAMVPWLGLWAGAADTPTPLPVAAANNIDLLIHQLADNQFPVREAAARALASLPDTTLVQLRKGLTLPDPEIRRRLTDVIASIERTSALSPRLVTLHLTRRSLIEVIRELTRQTGYQFISQSVPTDDKLLYTFDFDRLPFWEALDRVCAAGNLTHMPWNNSDRIGLNYQESWVPHVYRTGPFRVLASNFQYNQSIDLSHIPKKAVDAGLRSESLDFSFIIQTEPKLPILGVGPVRLIAAYDEFKQSMVPEVEQPMVGEEIGFTGECAIPTSGQKGYIMSSTVQLVRPSKKARAVKFLKGSVMVTMIREQKPEIIIDNVIKSKGKKAIGGKVTWSIEDFVKDPNPAAKAFSLKMNMSLASNDAARNAAVVNTLHQRIELQDAKGNKYETQVQEWSASCDAQGGHVQGTMAFSDPGAGALGPPVRLVYNSWKTFQHEVTFEFKDLPLP